MTVSGVTLQEAIPLTPRVVTTGLSCIGRGGHDLLGIINESLNVGIRPYLACAVPEQPLSVPKGSEICTVTIQGQSISIYSISHRQCTNTWSVPVDLFFSCPVRFLSLTEVKSLESKIRDSDDIDVDLVPTQTGFLYAVIAVEPNIPPDLANKVVRLWRITEESNATGPILDMDAYVEKIFDIPIVHISPLRGLVVAQQSSGVLMVHSDTSMTITSQDLGETLLFREPEKTSSVVLWCDSKSFLDGNSENYVLSLSIVLKDKSGYITFCNYNVFPNIEGKPEITKQKTFSMQRKATGGCLNHTFEYQREKSTLLMASLDSKVLEIYNLSSEEMSDNYYSGEIKFEEYGINTNNLPFPRFEMRDLGSGYFAVICVIGDKYLMDVWDSCYKVRHCRKILPKIDDKTRDSVTHSVFSSLASPGSGEPKIFLSRVDAQNTHQMINFSLCVDFIQFSCCPLNTLLLLGKNTLTQNVPDYVYHEGKTNTYSLDTTKSEPVSKIIPPIQKPFELNFGRWEDYASMLWKFDSKYVQLLCDNEVVKTELDFDITFCKFIQARERFTLGFLGNELDNNCKSGIHNQKYLDCPPSRAVLSRLNETCLPQQIIYALLSKCFSDSRNFWPRSVIFYLLRCGYEISSKAFSRGIISSALDRGDLSVVEKILEKIPDISEAELVDILKWACGSKGSWDPSDELLEKTFNRSNIYKKAMRDWVRERIFEELGENSRPGFRKAEYLLEKAKQFQQLQKTSKRHAKISYIKENVDCIKISKIKPLIFRTVFYRSFCKEFMINALRSLSINELMELTYWCISEITGKKINNDIMKEQYSEDIYPSLMNRLLDCSEKNILESEVKLNKFSLDFLKPKPSCLKALEAAVLLIDAHFSTFLHTLELRDCIKFLHKLVHDDTKTFKYLAMKLNGPLFNISSLISKRKANKQKLHDSQKTHKKRLKRMVRSTMDSEYSLEVYRFQFVTQTSSQMISCNKFTMEHEYL